MSDATGKLSGPRSWTIAIRPKNGEPLRKITKIIGLNGSGFSVLAPYHKAREGHLLKIPIDRKIASPGVHKIRRDERFTFNASDRVKLTYHVDGFAQFSGENKGKILSGRDPTTGKPKGLGLLSRPFSAPIWSGPSVGVTVWGIEDFDASDVAGDDFVIFEPSDFYYRACSPADANAWHLEFYVFPSKVVPPVRYDGGSEVFDAVPRDSFVSPGTGSVVRLKIIRLRREEVFLGAYVNRMITGFPSKSESGWTLSGPGDYSSVKAGHVLVAFYPAQAFGNKPEKSLDLAPFQTAAPAERRHSRLAWLKRALRRKYSVSGTMHMNILKTFTFTWRQGLFFKWGVFALGIAVGAYWQQFFAPYVPLLIIFAALSLAYPTYVWWKQ